MCQEQRKIHEPQTQLDHVMSSINLEVSVNVSHQYLSPNSFYDDVPYAKRRIGTGRHKS